MSASARHSAIEGFVRETLGCACPDEVFAAIEDGERGGLRRIAVGGRLLVYLVAPARGGLTADQLDGYLSRGRRERDELGFNRFRLVIAADDERTTEAEALTGAFERLRAGDERLHLHLIPSSRLPPT